MTSLIKKAITGFTGLIKGSPTAVHKNQVRRLIKKTMMGVAGLVMASSIAIGSYFLIDYGIKQRIAQYEERDRSWTRQGLTEGIAQYGQEDRERTAEDFRIYEERDRSWTRQGLTEGIAQYEGRDEQRAELRESELKKYTKARLGEYEEIDKEWTGQNFEPRVPLELFVEALDSTYKVVNQAYYETREGEMINPGGGSGSGILLKGGYLLTARHVVDESFPPQFSHSYWGLVKYHHNELSIEGHNNKLEMILAGRSRALDYALLKLENSENLSFYHSGLNIPDKPVLGMRSAAIGFPLGTGRNIRLGNVSQVKSNVGPDFLTFKNSIIFGDSGGPIFVLEDNKVKLASISSMLTIMRDHEVSGVVHPTNIGYGLKVSSMIEDMERRLASGEFDEETAKKVVAFLQLNK